MPYALIDRLQSVADAAGLPMEPLHCQSIDLWDGRSRTTLGYDIVGEVSQERLWIRALEHWRPTRMVCLGGFWWPESEPLGGLHPAQGEEGRLMVLGALNPGSRQAMREDLAATLVWIREMREKFLRFTTRAALERVDGELGELLSSMAPDIQSAPTETSQGNTQERFEDRLRELLEQRLAALGGAGEVVRTCYSERLERERQAIREHELHAFFYVMADLGAWSKAHRIRFGPGQGALPSSMVAWLLGVTDMDPVANELVFERWLAESDLARRRVTLQIAPGHAQELDHLAQQAARHGEAIVRVQPLPGLALLEHAFSLSGFRKPPHPCWLSSDPLVFEELRKGLPASWLLDPEGSETALAAIHPMAYGHLMAWTVLGHAGSQAKVDLDAYIARRHGRAPVPRRPDFAAEALRDTFGLLLYQEQMIRILASAMDCSPLEAEQLRRDLVSKNPMRIQRARGQVVKGGLAQGWSRQDLETVLDEFEVAGPEVVCKSHAAARAAFTYELAWWRTYHPSVLSQAMAEKGRSGMNHGKKGLNSAPSVIAGSF